MVKRKNLRGKQRPFVYWNEMESVIDKILSKKEVDDEAFELRDKLYELFRKEIREVCKSNLHL